MGGEPVPCARCRRTGLILATDIPAAVLAAIGPALGRDIGRTELLSGGYTPQVVLRLHFSGGDTAVAKVAPPPDVDGRLDWPGEVGKEIELFSSRPELDPWRPRFVAGFEAGGWRGFVMEDLGCALRPPSWTAEAIDAVAAGLAAMHQAGRLPGGRTVVHGDVRSDNLFLVPGRGLVLCDWAEAGEGSSVDDAIYWAVGVELESGINAEAAVDRYAALGGEVAAVSLEASLDRLLDLTRERLASAHLPAPVRKLRAAELDVLVRLHARKRQTPCGSKRRMSVRTCSPDASA